MRPRPARRFGMLLLTIVILALAPLAAPHDPTDLARLELLDASLPPAWQDGGDLRYPLGTDAQGRCMLSAVLYGLRLSLFIALATVAASLGIGSTLGAWAGYRDGWPGQAAMRLADAMAALHPVLLAMLLVTVTKRLAPAGAMVETGALTTIVALSAAGWAQHARLASALTRAGRQRGYVQAAWLMGQPDARILFRHVLPNIAPPLLGLALLQLVHTIFAEATLSFLGFGLPPAQPSLGGMIRGSAELLLSGAWWMVVLPAAALSLLLGFLALLADGAPSGTGLRAA